MGFVSGLLGTAGGVNGTGISGPQSGNVLNPTTVDQANTAYTGAQNSLDQQQQFLQALQGQNGIQNQSNVFNQLQGVANGTGPNPAQAQLAQATQANVANQAALMAGQRGSGANAGLIARQAAMQGANTQQQAAGQAATMQANQSLNALGQLGGIAGQQVGQQAAATGANTQAQQSEQQNLLNSIAQQNNSNVGMQSNVNSANAGLAGSTMQGQQNMLGNITGGAGSALGLAKGGMIPHMYRGGYSPVSVDYNNNDNVFDTSQTASGATDMSTVGPQAAVPAPATPMAPRVPTAAPAPQVQAAAASAQPGPKSSAGKFFQGFNQSANGNSNQPQGTGIAGNMIGKGIGSALKSIFGSGSSPQPQGQSNSETQLQNQLLQHGAYEGSQQDVDATNNDVNSDGDMMAARGGKVPAMVSPGEKYLAPKDVKKVEQGKNPMEVGEKIPGKAKVKGAKNSYANDTVPKTLEEGGIVLPRSVTQAKNPHWAAHAFVSQIMAKNGKSLPKKPSKK